MSKKITSVLVLLTALLLTLPSQAQIQNQAFTPVKKKAVTEMQGQRKTLKVKPADATVQANAAPARTAEEKKLSFLEEQYLIDKAAKEAETPAPAWNWAKQTAPKFVTKSDLIKPLNFRGNLASTHKVKPFVGNDITSAASNRAATTNAYGIITAPDEGESKFYTRAGTAYYASSNQVYSAAQSGTVEIVEAADGTVYIKDIISRYSQGTWVKGTKAGNTITVAAGQPVQYNANYSTTLGVYWGNYDESTDNGWNKQAGDITFTVDEAAGTISLVGSNQDLYVGIFWDDDDSFAGYGDYETVWTLDEGYVPPSEELVELPAGATVETWYREQTNATSTGSTAVTGDAKVAIVDNEVYISGMFTQFPDAWIKGTIEGTTVTFAGGQFIGYYGGTTPIWAFGTDGNALTDFTATYDAAAKSLVADNDLLANGAADRIYYLQWIEGLSLYAEQPAPAQIDELPYSNDFSDATLTKHFTVIDANGDGTTWGASSGSFAISYADANDDWLVSPAIKLVAGKKYHVALDSWVRSAGYPETFEVKAATEASAEALAAGTTVIASQAISNSAAQTFENNEFTVAETGYYYIGIHNTSYDAWAQYVDNFLIEAAPITAPYSADLTQAGAIDDFSVIDNNGDGTTWAWTATNGIYYSYNSNNAADDYLILPIKLEAGKNYNVVVTAAAAASSYPEKFEVVAGKTGTVAGLTTTVIPETTVDVTANTEYAGTLTTDEAGTYYVAIHATSAADMYQLRLKKLVIEVGAEPTAPAAVSDLAVTAGAEGALQATLTFTAPATAVNGSALSGTEDVKIYRDDALVNTLTAVAPGSAQTWTDTEVTTGTVTYYVVAANESGDGQKSQKVSVYVGEDQLADVENVVAAATPSSIAFSWNEATGLNGGYVDLANVEYNVWSLAIEAGYFGNYLVEDQILKTVTGETTATIDYDTMTGEQEYKYFGVSAANAAGETDPVTNYAYVLVGAPDELPIEENFTGNSLHYNWDTNGGLGVDTDTSDGDGSALKLYNNGNSADVFFVLPKVNLNPAGNPTLMFDVKAGVGVDKVIAYGAVAGGEAVDLAEFNVTDEYTTVKAPLNSIKGGAYASVGIRANIPTASLQQYEDYVLIDNIKIVDLLEYNLNINVTAPSNVNVGETATVKATVRNVGEFAASGYTVIIKAGDKELLNETVNEELASFATKELTAELETSIFDEATSVEITASVVYANDLDEDDNEASAVVTLKASAAAGPSNVAAEEDAENPGNINVTWNAPDNATQAVVEDFASYENGADETGELGDWTLINANGHTKGGIFEDVTLASDGQVRAWQVFNLATYGGDNSAFAGPDGDVDNNYLISTYNLEDSAYPGNDDWLISPSLPGVAQSVSFDVKAFNDYGPQTYQVLYSTTDNQPESFTLIEEVEDNGNAWNNVSYNLPEGTTYFAIRNVTGGDSGFILAVDNITFTVGGGEVDHYNIYLDEEQVAQVGVDGEEITVNAEALHRAAAALSYTIAGVEPGEHKVAVTVVYTNGQESSPVAAGTNTVVTGIVKLLIEGQPVDIYTIDGKLVRQQTTNLNGLSGAYIINGKKVILK
ncbi:MAG: hypothetical protein IJ527_10600 [Prevotella sp.]|nr:hypothetical protein [Prevotella sp.]